MDAGQIAIVTKRFAVFDAIDPAGRHALLAAARPITLDKGQRLYAVGERAVHAYLLALGTVKVGIPSPQGERVLGYLHAGDLLGEATLDNDTWHDEEAVAIEPAFLCALPSAGLRELMRQTPALAVEMTRLIGRRLRAMRARVEQLGAGRAEARIAHVLLTLARELGTDVGGRVVIPLRLSQTELANLVGLRRETVNIVLLNLRRRGLFASERHGIELQDLGSLASIA